MLAGKRGGMWEMLMEHLSVGWMGNYLVVPKACLKESELETKTDLRRVDR
jgi:hypothetical protein